MFQTITINTSPEGILQIVLNRPESLNALNDLMLSELKSVIQSSYTDQAVKGIIITGQGTKAFVAGADIREISGLKEDLARSLSENGQEIFALIENHTKPVVAAINGFALGGGCELAMACHIRIAVPTAKFGQPEVNLGLIPGYGGTQRLTQLIGKGRAFELMMTGDLISASDALTFGLVNKIVDSHAELIPECLILMNKILTKSPFAIGRVIHSVNAHFNAHQDGYKEEANNFASCTTTEDFKEGIDAFLTKRKPNFTGK